MAAMNYDQVTTTPAWMDELERAVKKVEKISFWTWFHCTIAFDPDKWENHSLCEEFPGESSDKKNITVKRVIGENFREY